MDYSVKMYLFLFILYNLVCTCMCMYMFLWVWKLIHSTDISLFFRIVLFMKWIIASKCIDFYSLTGSFLSGRQRLCGQSLVHNTIYYLKIYSWSYCRSLWDRLIGIDLWDAATKFFVCFKADGVLKCFQYDPYLYHVVCQWTYAFAFVMLVLVSLLITGALKKQREYVIPDEYSLTNVVYHSIINMFW